MLILLMAVIYLAFFSMGLPDGMIGAAWPSMYQGFGVPVSTAGGVTMLVSSGTVISALCANALISRWGTWRITVGSTLLTAVALVGFALAPSYAWLCASALPLGLGAGAIDAVLNYEKSNYIYFCAKPEFDGTHNFASTYSQHQKNARAYQKALDKISKK
jgi:predicted MFS family arabinose efflux permease